MRDDTCPWCECTLELRVDQADEQQCPECLTSWTYVEDLPDLRLAA